MSDDPLDKIFISEEESESRIEHGELFRPDQIIPLRTAFNVLREGQRRGWQGNKGRTRRNRMSERMKSYWKSKRNGRAK